MSEFTEAVVKAVAKKSLEGIDIDTMAKKLRPKLEKEIEQGLEQALKDDGYICDLIDYSIIETYINQTLRKTLGVPEKKKRK